MTPWVEPTLRTRRATSESEAEDLIRESLFLPAHLPPVTALVAGQDGSIWLQRERGIGGEAEWWVLDGELALQARIVAPRDLEIMDASTEHVWGVRKDELGLEFVERYRIGRLRSISGDGSSYDSSW